MYISLTDIYVYMYIYERVYKINRKIYLAITLVKKEFIVPV